MRVLFLVRSDLEARPGGDTVQIHNTACALRDIGVQVEIDDSKSPSFSGQDIVHLFHLDRPWQNLSHVRKARASGCSVVLSPIYWPMDEFNRQGRTGFQRLLARRLKPTTFENLRLAYSACFNAIEGSSRRILYDLERAQREILASTAVLLPNSHAEANELRQRFDCETPHVIVPNAADDSLYTATSQDPPTTARSGVLYVGRIEPRKNQLGLIRALAGSGIPLTFAGKSGFHSGRYEQACRKAAGDSVRFLGHCEPRDLPALYRSASVHCCPSWYETPGLASLEAALCGCSLVVTSRGSTREYFRDDVSYCDPGDVDSIRAAILTALDAEQSPELIDRARKSYCWKNTALRTIEGYELSLRKA